MVDGAETTPGATPDPPAAGESQQSSELEAQLEALRAELTATRQEIKGLQGEAAKQSELEKLQASLERAKKQRDRLLNPPKLEPTAEDILKQQLREARQQLQALKANPDKEAAVLRQKLRQAQRDLELAQSVQSSTALRQARAINAEIANLKANLQDATAAIKRQTGWATVEAIAAEVGAVQKELGVIQTDLVSNRVVVGLVLAGVCWIAIASAEAFHFSRMAWQRVSSLPGMGLLMSSSDEEAKAAAAPLPATATPIQKGDTVAGYLVTSGFGSRVPPCNGCSAMHLGVDLATPTGTPVYAPYEASVECRGGLSDPAGNYAVLKPKTKGPEFLLLHLDGCQAGEFGAGQRIGTSGSTGLGTGPHLDVRQIESGDYVVPTKEWVERILTGKVPAMKSNPPSNAADFIAEFEGFHPQPYWDYAQYTWGFGTKAPGPNGYISREQARAELNQRIAQDNQLLDHVVTVPLSPGQRTALLSFQFNTGALEGSQLLAKLNAGDKAGAAAEFDRWINAGGAPLEGLRRRREAEKQLFLK